MDLVVFLAPSFSLSSPSPSRSNFSQGYFLSINVSLTSTATTLIPDTLVFAEILMKSPITDAFEDNFGPLPPLLFHKAALTPESSHAISLNKTLWQLPPGLYVAYRLLHMPHISFLKILNKLSLWLSSKELSCQCRRCRRCWFNPRVGKIPWRRNGNPLHKSCLENRKDRRACLAIMHGVAKSWTGISN